MTEEAGTAAEAPPPHPHATLVQAFQAELAAIEHDPEKLGGLAETIEDLATKVAGAVKALEPKEEKRPA